MAETLFPERTAWPEMEIKKSIQKMERPKLKHFYFYPSIYLPTYLPIYLSIYLSNYVGHPWTSLHKYLQPLRMWPCLLSPAISAMKNRNMPPHAVCIPKSAKESKLKRRIKSINHNKSIESGLSHAPGNLMQLVLQTSLDHWN